ncbi:MAG: branched-chain amino acid ABC transporter substrate-binding protein [Ardenticatenaceae bacterium]|nr:branched-chain amino acid ABC transporter substrate-binding protein [Ardenticatenaceae bacterium]
MSWLKVAVCCLVLTMCGGLLAGCTDPDLVCEDVLGCVQVGANDPIRVGYLLALTGDGGYLGQDSLRGMEMALAERDALFMGHPIELVGADTGCVVETGRLAALATADNPSLVGVIGPTCSAVAEAVIPIINRAGLVMISPSSTRPDLPLVDGAATGEWQKSFFRTVPNALWQGQVAAEFATQALGVTSAAVIYDETVWSEALRQSFVEAFMALGGQVMFMRQMTVGQTDVSELMTLVSSSQPELIYLPLFEPEASLLINNLPANPERVLLGADSLLLPSFAESAGTAVRGMAVTGPAVAGAAHDAFLEQWAVTYGDVPQVPYHAYAYDGVAMLLAAAEAVAQEGRNGELLIGRQALREVLAERPFVGLSGTLACQGGECSRPAAIGVYQLTDEQILGRVWPPPLIWQPTEQ